MSEEIDNDTSISKGRPKTISLSLKDILLLCGALIGIFTFAGQWFVYGDRVTKATADIVEMRKDIRDGSDKIVVMEQWLKNADPVLNAMSRHVADRSIHTSSEDVTARIALQLQPFLIDIQGVKKDVATQQKQLDHIEKMLEEFTQEKKPTPSLNR